MNLREEDMKIFLPADLLPFSFWVGESHIIMQEQCWNQL